MERPVIRAGIAPAEDPSLFTANCYGKASTECLARRSTVTVIDPLLEQEQATIHEVMSLQRAVIDEPATWHLLVRPRVPVFDAD